MVQVMELKNGQKLITVPSKICEAYQLKKGDKLKFEYMFKAGKIEGVTFSKC